MAFPALKHADRDREYYTYSTDLRARVVYEYLFNRRSHRWMDENVLKLDFDGRGFQSMGILHYLGLVNEHKGVFNGSSVNDAVKVLEAEGTLAHARIAEHLRSYPRTADK
jgi:hypothetical protein